MQQGSTIPQQQFPPSPDLENPTPQTSNDKGEGFRSIVSTIAILIAAPLLALFLTAFVFQSYEVDGPSMETTLQNQDRLIVLKVPRTIARITHHTYLPNRGDVIIFVKRGLTQFGEPNEDKQLIKRVIALPGEHVVVKDGVVTVYNKEHPEGFNPDVTVGYSNAPKLSPGNVDLVVPDGEIFVCGDNRTNSLDSRSFGTVPASDLVGKLVFRLLPVSKTKLF